MQEESSIPSKSESASSDSSSSGPHGGTSATQAADPDSTAAIASRLVDGLLAPVWSTIFGLSQKTEKIQAALAAFQEAQPVGHYQIIIPNQLVLHANFPPSDFAKAVASLREECVFLIQKLGMQIIAVGDGDEEEAGTPGPTPPPPTEQSGYK